MRKQIKEVKKINKLIEVKGLVKTFKNVKAVNNISFVINEGENLALVGANGAGKTTTVELLLGIDKKDGGNIIYNFGSKQSKQGSSYKNNQFMGAQFQDSTYPQFISVKRIVNFIIDAYFIKMTEDELKHMCGVFKVTPFFDKPASSLSGGQSQRLNIMLSLLHKPKLVILDELSTGLDITTRNEFKIFIKDYCKKNGITILIISHDAGEIFYLCDRVLVMLNGSIVAEAMVKDFKDPQKLEEFINKKISVQ